MKSKSKFKSTLYHLQMYCDFSQEWVTQEYSVMLDVIQRALTESKEQDPCGRIYRILKITKESIV